MRPSCRAVAPPLLKLSWFHTKNTKNTKRPRTSLAAAEMRIGWKPPGHLRVFASSRDLNEAGSRTLLRSRFRLPAKAAPQRVPPHGLPPAGRVSPPPGMRRLHSSCSSREPIRRLVLPRHVEGSPTPNAPRYLRYHRVNFAVFARNDSAANPGSAGRQAVRP